MSETDAIKFIWMILLLPLGWLWKLISNNRTDQQTLRSDMEAKIDDLRTAINEDRVNVSANYVTRTDVEKMVDRLEEKIDKILEHLMK